MPGSIFNQGCQGTPQLIRQGAYLAVDVADIVKTLVGSADQTIIRSAASRQGTIICPRRISPHASPGRSTIHRFAHQIKSSNSSQTLAAISMLEIKGLIESTRVGEYRAA